MSTSLAESMEVLAHQINSDYIPRLVGLFEQAIVNADKLDKLDEILHQIAYLTRDTIGIWMEPRFTEGNFLDGKYNVMMEAPSHEAFNPLNVKSVERMKNLDLNNFKVEQLLNGTIDFKNCRVDGCFKELHFLFMISPECFDGYLEARELAAIYLHEVGHAWSMIVFLGQSIITNIVLAELVSQMYDAPVERQLEIGKAAVKLTGNDDELPADADISTVTAIVLKNEPKRIQDRVGSRWYDKRLAEAVADQFAARWMVGASLVKAIGKIERSKNILMSHSGFDPIWVGVASNLFNLASFPFKYASQGAAALATQILKSYGMSTGINFAVIAGIDLLTNNSYHTPEDRIEAIRRETVNLLKDRSLPDNVRKQALADLQTIDDELKKVHNFGDVMNKLVNWAYGRITSRSKELGHQKTMEELANNRLYELSAYLRG